MLLRAASARRCARARATQRGRVWFQEGWQSRGTTLPTPRARRRAAGPTASPIQTSRGAGVPALSTGSHPLVAGVLSAGRR